MFSLSALPGTQRDGYIGPRRLLIDEPNSECRNSLR